MPLAPRQRASAVIIQAGKILMVRVLVDCETWWCLPGGTIEPGETPQQALVRELREELNLSVTPGACLYQAPLIDEQGVDYGIVAELEATTPTLGIDPAVVEWGWRALDEVHDCWQVDEVRKALGAGIA